MKEKVSRKLAAILAADVVGYSRHIAEDEERTIERFRSILRDVIDPRVARDNGRIVKTMGDGLLIEFPSVVDAVRNAIDFQRSMAERNSNLSDEQKFEFRVGINLGDIVIDGEDILGDGVNIAARLEPLAEPGGIALSGRVYEVVRDRLNESFADSGEQVLKNISRPVQVFHWVPENHIGQNVVTPAGVRQRPTRPFWVFAALALLVALGTASLWRFTRPQDSEIQTREALRSTSTSDEASKHQSARIRIVVLPFVNQSGDATQDYFSDGITEDLIAALGRFSSLAVIARNAAYSYKGKTIKSEEIGREMGVRYIVDGSVRRVGERIRVSAQLSEADTGTLLWSQRYDRSLDDVFAVQDSITHQVAGALAISLSRIEQARAAAKPTENLDAYDLLLRGRELIRLTSRSSNRQARALLERAIRLDPSYASSYAMLARANMQVADFGWSEDPAGALDRAFALSQKALASDPDNVEALNVISGVYAIHGKYEPALAASNRALAINPSNARSMQERSAILLWLGRIEESISAAETSLQFDPDPPAGSIVIFALAYYQAQRHADAARLLESGILRYPNHGFLYAMLAASYGQMGKKQEAARAVAELRRHSPFFDVAAFGSRFRNEANQAYLSEGLAKAGLN